MFKGNDNKVIFDDKPEDDPRRRKPDISVAKNQLNWEPKYSLKEGLEKTISYFQNELRRISYLENYHNNNLYFSAEEIEQLNEYGRIKTEF